ncbi:MAG: D-2-hydroxyacid dehydrogenase [Bacillota bacterium]|nr:D-2-hydroxyacid dehydrogenase [Bacillota bacterium]
MSPAPGGPPPASFGRPVTVLVLTPFFRPQAERVAAAWPQVRWLLPPQGEPPAEGWWRELGEALASVEVVVAGGNSRLAPLLPHLPRLAWVHAASAGVDRLVEPLREAARAGRRILLTNASGTNAVPIAEHVILLILALARRLPEYVRQQQERLWRPHGARELQGSTLVVAGYGAIGREVARRAHGLGMRVLGLRRRAAPGGEGDGWAERIAGPEAARAFFAEADYLLLALPRTPETEHYLDAEKIGWLPQRAVVVNVGRGALVDEAALLEALRAGRIAGAALDVFEREPLPAESPLWAEPRLLITPHVAWASPETPRRGAELFADNLRRYLAGEPLRNPVELEAAY